MADIVSQVPGPDGKPIKAEVINFKTEHEEWNTYKLEDGSTLRVKINMVQALKGIDASTGGTLFMDNGEPYYSARHAVQVVADVPEFLMRKDGEV